MGSYSKLTLLKSKRKCEINSCDKSCKRFKSDGCLLKLSSLTSLIKDIKPLPLEELMKNLRHPDVAVNIATIDLVRKLFESKKSFDSGFLLDDDFILEVINCSYLIDQDEFYIAAIRMISAIIKRENEESFTCVSIVYLLVLMVFDRPNMILCRETLLALRNVEFLTDLATDMFVSLGGIKILLNFLNAEVEQGIVNDITHILFKLFKARPELTDDQQSLLLTVLRRLMFHPSEVVLGNVCGILDQLSKSLNGPLDEIIDTKIIPHVVEHLNDSSLFVSMKSLNIISNFVSFGSVEQKKHVLQYNVLPAITEFFENKFLKTQAFDIINGCLQGGIEDIQNVLDSNFAETMLKFLKNDDIEVCQQSNNFFQIIAVSGSWEQIKIILDMGLIIELFTVLKKTSVDSIQQCTMTTIRSYFDAVRLDIRTMKNILNETSGLLDVIDRLKELPNAFEIRFEAFQLGYNLLSAWLWVDEYLQSA